MCEHGGGGAPGDEFLEMACLPVALHGRVGMGTGVHHLPRRAVAGLGLSVLAQNVVGFRITPRGRSTRFLCCRVFSRNPESILRRICYTNRAGKVSIQ